MHPSANMPGLRFVVLTVLFTAMVFSLIHQALTRPSDNLVQAQAVIDPADPAWEPDQVMRMQAVPFTGVLARPNNRDVFWLRVAVAPHAPGAWSIQVLPPYVSEATVFRRDAAGRWHGLSAGMRVGYPDHGAPNTGISMSYSPVPQGEVVLIRMRTDSGPVLVRILPEPEALRQGLLLHVIAALLSGMLLVVALITTNLWLASRHPLWACQTLYLVTSIVMILWTLGLIDRYWPGEPGEHRVRAFEAAMVAYFALALHTFYRVFRLFSFPAWMRWPHHVGVSLAPLLILLVMKGEGDLALRLNNLVLVMLALFGLVGVWVIRHQDKALEWTFRLLFLLLVSYMVSWVVPFVMGDDQTAEQILYPLIQSHILLVMIVPVVAFRDSLVRLASADAAQRDLQRISTRLDGERTRLEDMHAFIGLLLHEIKGPLSTIRLAATNLRQDMPALPVVVARRLERIFRAVDGVDRVLRRSVDMDVLEQGALQPRLLSCDLLTIVDETLGRYDTTRIMVTVEASDTRVNTDPALLSMILGNLVENAMRYGEPRTPIRLVIAEGNSGALCVSLFNQVSPGAAPDPARVFTKYYRAPTSAGRSGLGLGLYWCRQVLNQLQGRITFGQRENEVRFTVWIPR